MLDGVAVTGCQIPTFEEVIDLVKRLDGNLFGEIETYPRAGIDALFTDTADIGIVARDEFLKG